jgi:chromate transporter
MMNRLKEYLRLAVLFFKIGLFTFGGGYAMIALLENEFVSRRNWIDREEFLDMVAIAESTPGPIAINAATYIGYRLLAFPGALLATVAVCVPSFAIIYVISLFFDAFLALELVANAFLGIRVGVICLILSAGLKMLRQMKKTLFNVVITVSIIVCMVTLSLFSVHFSSIFYILLSGALGLFVYLLRLLRRKEATGE